MNAYRKLVTLFAFALAAAALSVGSASAQVNTPEVRGTFTLPFEAHWGKATLPAGKYTFEEVDTNGHQRMVEVRSEAKGTPLAFAIVSVREPSLSANRSELVCIRQGKIGIVRSLVMANLGEILYFTLRKTAPLYAQNRDAKTRTLLAQAPELIQRVPVEVAGL